MDFLTHLFPVSGVETSILIPPAVAFVISFFGAMGGVSGAFLILPFQMTVLQFTAPSVSATNFLYNIVAIPGGVYHYVKEERMVWPLTWTIILGTVPGILAGYYCRIYFLPDPRVFKFFVGCVLLYIASRLFYEVVRSSINRLVRENAIPQENMESFGLSQVKTSWKKTQFEFQGRVFGYKTLNMFALSLVVGVIGGIYGVGGGAIIAPFCVAVFHLPVYTIAGATLMGTFVASIAGVIFYSLLGGAAGISVRPDWLLGFLFGIGGFAGVYLGARTQKYMPERLIKTLLGAATLFVALKYIRQFFS